MNKISKILLSVFIALFFISTPAYWASLSDNWDDLKDEISDWTTWSTNKSIVNWMTSSLNWWISIVSLDEDDDWIDIISSLFVWFKGELFSIIMVISIAVFIFIGIRLSTSKWNPEEFKKAMTHLIYSIVWIFVIFMAWWLVKLVSSLSL